MIKRRRKKSYMAEMNMIPLIDISLILLIIFMVMSPFLVQSQINVTLPKSSSAASIVEDDIIRIQISSKGVISVLGKTVTIDKLNDELVLRMGNAKNKTVLVQADREVPIDLVVKVFDVAKGLGAGSLGIGVDEITKKK